jgi:predicted CXXCH cytochrome family protein
MAGFVGMTVLVCALRLASPITSLAYSSDTKLPALTAARESDRVCAGCHREIYDRYQSTPMSLGSGAAIDGLLPGSFQHQASGVEYKTFLREGKAWLSYRRAGAGSVPDLGGEYLLRYFVGSGHRGRTYLYEQSGLWFEAPINYYSKKSVWDMAPNYEASRAMPDALPVDSNCLHCHASEVQTALPAARNRYSTVPFLEGGIRCAACHGDPTEHLAKQGHGPIVNPSHLAPAKRDSICLQCHLEGDAAIYRAGRSLADFHPGSDLADNVTYFVKASAEAGGGRAASQYEALLRSRCKIGSGDKLTCTTCHDPHGSPSEAERVSFFRNKCLACHTGEKIAVEHHPEQQDCAVCHMPTRKTTDISHEQTTDHNIQRVPSTSTLTLTALGEPSYRLIPVGNIVAGDREAGLAYAQAALRGNREARQQALKLLESAEAAGADDAALHAQLGLMNQMAGRLADAEKEYDRALAEDPNDATALGNKAVLEAATGQAADSVRLLRRVLENDPSQVAATLNLAFIECTAGDRRDAGRILADQLRFNPDDPALQRFIHSGIYGGQRCDVSSAAEAGTPH